MQTRRLPTMSSKFSFPLAEFNNNPIDVNNKPWMVAKAVFLWLTISFSCLTNLRMMDDFFERLTWYFWCLVLLCWRGAYNYCERVWNERINHRGVRYSHLTLPVVVFMCRPCGSGCVAGVAMFCLCSTKISCISILCQDSSFRYLCLKIEKVRRERHTIFKTLTSPSWPMFDIRSFILLIHQRGSSAVKSIHARFLVCRFVICHGKSTLQEKGSIRRQELLPLSLLRE